MGLATALYFEQEYGAAAEIFDVDVDATGFDLGFGYAFPLSDTMDLYGKLGYTEVELEAFNESVDDDGYALSLGLRARVMEQLELAGSVNYVDLSDSGDDTAQTHHCTVPEAGLQAAGELRPGLRGRAATRRRAALGCREARGHQVEAVGRAYDVGIRVVAEEDVPVRGELSQLAVPDRAERGAQPPPRGTLPPDDPAASDGGGAERRRARSGGRWRRAEKPPAVPGEAG